MQNNLDIAKLVKFVLLAGTIGTVVIGGLWWWNEQNQPWAIRNFKECAARYEVVNAQPRQCTTPDNRLFIEE